VPVVAKVERCGWERWDWALRGVATFELGAAAVELRALSDDEVTEPKYAYPISGRVLARSKKLLEVTPEALEERRRKLPEETRWTYYDPEVAAANAAMSPSKLDQIHAAVTKPESISNPCGRRLDGVDLSDEERRRLGVTGCLSFEGGTSSSFAVSLGRAASKRPHAHDRSTELLPDHGNVRPDLDAHGHGRADGAMNIRPLNARSPSPHSAAIHPPRTPLTEASYSQMYTTPHKH
jgi:hypothetical protein